MVKVTGTKTEVVEVDVVPLEVFRALKTYLFTAHQLPTDSYIKGGKIVVDKNYYTSHSWIEEVVLHEEPSKDQLEVMNTVASLARLIDKAQKI